jgi:serine protease Do
MEDVMRQKFLHKLVLLILISIFAAMIFVIAGCEKKERTEIIGFPQSFADLAEKVRPSVVNIRAETTLNIPGSPFKHFFGTERSPFDDFFKRFFGNIPDRELKQKSLGSGFIVDRDGYIITNNHVVENAQEIKVKLADGREFNARVVGRDPKTDLALIKISSVFKDLPTLSLGDSDSIRVGDWVLAIGNPFGLEHTVTQGIISARGRAIGSGPYDNFLQTDAPINPGNSGGPLVNLKGEVIGINTAIIATGQGIGFAIPINTAKSVISQLKEKGKVTRGWIGVSVQTVTPEIANSFGLKEPKGALVGDIALGGPADSAGAKRGDIITEFDGKNIKNMSDLPRIVAETPVGKEVDMKVLREGKEINLRLKVAEMTEERLASQMSVPEKDIGITVANIDPHLQREFGIKDKSGVVVVNIEPGSPADDAGIQAGDIIKEVNRIPIKNMKDYESAMVKWKKDRPVLFLVRRDNQTFYISINVS